MMFKLCLLEYVYNLSDVEVVEIPRTDIGFRWFLNLSLDDATPDDTTVSYFRCKRLADKAFEEIFNEIVWKCINSGIVKTNRYIIDSTNVDANVNYPSEKKTLCKAYIKVIDLVFKIDEDFATKKLNQFQADINSQYKNQKRYLCKPIAK